MKRIILSDTCLELNEELEKKINIKLIPVHLDLGENTYLDDENLNVRDFIDEMHAYKGVPGTAAPSPQAFYDAMLDYDEIFVITISSKLSTIYNSADIAKNMILEDHPDKKVHVFDSRSAVSGQTLMAIKIQDMIDKGLSFEEIVEKGELEVKNMRTFFILENLDNLVKNGRMSRLAGRIASALSINPVCVGVDGEIEVVTKTRGMKAGINKMVQVMTEGLDDIAERTLVISHVLKPERAKEIKDKALESNVFKDVQIVGSKGITSVYANEGGIVVAL